MRRLAINCAHTLSKAQKEIPMKNAIGMSVFIALIAISNIGYAATKTIGILVFDGVLTSDITAPAEVFGVASKESWFSDFRVEMIGVSDQPSVTTEEGLEILVDSHIGQVQNLEVLIIPSAYDMGPLLKNKKLIQFIQAQSEKASWLASNCSGAQLLAEAAVLDGKKATTWAGGESDLQKQYPRVAVQSDQNYVVDGNIVTSNGSVVSYTAALKLLSLMSSEALAKKVFDSLQMGRMIESY